MENNIQVKNGHIWVHQGQRMDIFGCNSFKELTYLGAIMTELTYLGSTKPENGHV